METAKKVAEEVVATVDSTDSALLKIALASLYMGEGAKKDGVLALGSTNPTILRFYIAALSQAFHVPLERLRVELHLRADQPEQDLMQYWLNELHLPQSAAGCIYKDVRTKGRPTYGDYRGVALVTGGGSAVHRELMYIGKLFFTKTGTKRAYSSAG